MRELCFDGLLYHCGAFRDKSGCGLCLIILAFVCVTQTEENSACFSAIFNIFLQVPPFVQMLMYKRDLTIKNTINYSRYWIPHIHDVTLQLHIHIFFVTTVPYLLQSFFLYKIRGTLGYTRLAHLALSVIVSLDPRSAGWHISLWQQVELTIPTIQLSGYKLQLR